MRARWVRYGMAALAVAVASGGAAVVLGWALAGCYVSWFPLGAEPLCGPGVWGAAWLPAVLLAVAVGGLLVWGVAVIRTGARQFGTARRFRRQLLAAATDHPLADESGSDLGVPIVVADVAFPLAVTVGLWQPQVVVTTGLLERLDAEEVTAVLQHERHHAQQRDPLMFGVVRTVADALFVLPVVRRWADRAVVEAEVAADAAAIDHAGRRPLLSALHTVANHPANVPTAAAYGSLHGMMEQRLDVLAGGSLPRAASRSTIALSVAGALLVTAPLAGIAIAGPRAGWGTASASCSPDVDPTCLPPGFEEQPVDEQPDGFQEPFMTDDGMLPVVDHQGTRVGKVEPDVIDQIARDGGRAPVVDDDGKQVGWWTPDGFAPLDDDTTSAP